MTFDLDLYLQGHSTLFWLGIQHDSIVWVIMRRQGVSSERRRSSCYSWIWNLNLLLNIVPSCICAYSQVHIMQKSALFMQIFFGWDAKNIYKISIIPIILFPMHPIWLQEQISKMSSMTPVFVKPHLHLKVSLFLAELPVCGHWLRVPCVWCGVQQVGGCQEQWPSLQDSSSLLDI